MSYHHHHISHQPLSPSGHSPPYPPPGFPPLPPRLGYTHTYHLPSPPSQPPPGYQGYYYEGYPPTSTPLPSPPLPSRNDYSDGGCTSFLTGCLAALCCCCLLEDCIL